MSQFNNYPTLDLIMGPMYSGKSTELIRRLSIFSEMGLKVLYVNSKIDNRSNDNFSTHSPVVQSLGKISTSVTIENTVVVGTGLTRITIPNAGKEGNWSEFKIQPRGILNEPVDNFSESDFQVRDNITYY